jgi:hypothetical protein
MHQTVSGYMMNSIMNEPTTFNVPGALYGCNPFKIHEVITG